MSKHDSSQKVIDLKTGVHEIEFLVMIKKN